MKKPVEFPIHLEYGISIPDFILALSQATEDLSLGYKSAQYKNNFQKIKNT